MDNKGKTLDELLNEVDKEEDFNPIEESEKRGRGRPTLEEAKKIADERFFNSIELTEEEVRTGEVEVRGIPDNIDVPKVIRKTIGREAIRLAKQNKALDDKDFYKLVTALGIMEKAPKEDKSNKFTKELRSSEVDELYRIRENIKKAKEKDLN